MPRIIPEPRYFSMPSAVVGGEERRKEALNCWPCSRSLTQHPHTVTHSPALISAAWPTTVTRSRWPRALMRNTQKPLLGLWKVTRSIAPASTSVGCSGGLANGTNRLPLPVGLSTAFCRLQRAVA